MRTALVLFLLTGSVGISIAAAQTTVHSPSSAPVETLTGGDVKPVHTPATKDRLSPERMEQLVARPMSILRASGLVAAQKDFDALLAAAVQAHGKGSVEEADLLTSFGVELFLADIDEDDASDAQASLEYLKRAIPAYRAAFGPRHPEVAVALNSYADALLQVKGDAALQEGEAALEEAYSIRVAALGPDNGETKSNARHLARLRETKSASYDVPPGPPDEAYLGLRDLALKTKASEMKPSPGDTDEPYGVVMDMDVHGATATITSFGDGHASLYLSTGGGTIGSGEASPEVAEAAKQFVAAARPFVPSMTRANTQPLPGPGEVIFYVLTPGGIYTATMPKRGERGSENTLSPLFHASQQVLTQIELLQERQDKERQQRN